MTYNLEETIHYIQVLRNNASIMQPEIRNALDHTLKILRARYRSKKI